jgi:hypothetical protein
MEIVLQFSISAFSAFFLVRLYIPVLTPSPFNARKIP